MKLGFSLLCCFYTLLSFSQTKKIQQELKRAAHYEESLKFDTYHVYEKYLSNQQRFELNMYYMSLPVKIPHESKTNYWLLNSARENNICAQLNLAYSYKIGRMVEKSMDKNAYWLHRAMKLKSKQACLYYGLNAANQCYSKASNDSAIYFLSSLPNHMEAQLILAFLYHYGISTAVNDSLSQVHWQLFLNLYRASHRDTAYVPKSLKEVIYYKTGFCNAPMMEKQLKDILDTLLADTSLKIAIETHGCGNYSEAQESWNKTNSIRNVLLLKGISEDRIVFNYAGKLAPWFVTFKFGKQDELEGPSIVPPPFPNFRDQLIMACD